MGNINDELMALAAAGVSEQLPPVKPPRNGTFQVAAEPVTTGEEEVIAHKFETAPPEPSPPPDRSPAADAPPVFEDLGPLPSSYQEKMLFLIARDPRWLFAYWDFNAWSYPAAEMRHGIVQFYLRILGPGEVQESLVEISPEARNWYVAVQEPGTDYIADLGYFEREGSWKSIVRSTPAHTPADGLATEAHADFATVPAHLTFERLLEMVHERMGAGESLISALARIAGEGRMEFRAGDAPTWTDDQKRVLATLLGQSLVDRLGMGSEEIDTLLRKLLHDQVNSESASGLLLGVSEQMGPGSGSLFSAIGASWSAQSFSLRAERGFFMHVNAEIIFYGGTHPDATVTMNGQRIELGADGTFRYHFTLGDGDYNIPIVATSPDRVEQRTAALSFQRGTARTGDVGATGQPAELDELIGRR